MLGRSLSNGSQKTFVLIFDKGDEVVRALTDFATAKRLSVGKADGTAHGGHLLEARVWPTLELVLTESPKHLRRGATSRPDWR